MHGESCSRVIINALRSSRAQVHCLSILVWIRSASTKESEAGRGREKNATRGDEVRSRAGRGKGGQPQQGSGRRSGESGVRRDRRKRRPTQARHGAWLPHPPSPQAKS